MNLLEIAKGISTNKRPIATPEETELVMAWAKDEITYSQAAKALEQGGGKHSKTAFYTIAAHVLKNAVTSN